MMGHNNQHTTLGLFISGAPGLCFNALEYPAETNIPILCSWCFNNEQVSDKLIVCRILQHLLQDPNKS